MRRLDVSDWLLVLGSLLIIAGVALWNIPAALIVAGLLCISFGLLIGKQNAVIAKSIRESKQDA